MIELALVQWPMVLTEVELCAWVFGEGSFFFSHGSGCIYILGPDEMGPDYSGMADASSAIAGPMSPEAFRAWLKAEGGGEPPYTYGGGAQESKTADVV